MGIRIAVVALVLGVVLAGCASPAAEPTDAAEEPVVTDTPTPTPTEPADPGPVVRVAATCEDFGELAAVQKLLPHARNLQLGTGEPGTGLNGFAQQQYGSLDCWWTADGTGSGADGDYIELTVAPETTDAQWSEIVALASGGSGVVTGGFPGEAYSNCAANPNGRSCRLDDRIGDWYIQVVMRSSEKAAEGVSRKWGNPFLKNAADVVAALPDPPARWQPESAVTFDRCSPVTDGGSLAEDLGYTTVDVVFVAPNSQSGASWIAGDALGYTICYLQAASGSTFQDLSLHVLPGGSWAWEQASAGGTPVDGIGDAAVKLNTSLGTSIVFVQGTTLALAQAQRDGAPSGADLGAVATTAARNLAGAL